MTDTRSPGTKGLDGRGTSEARYWSAQVGYWGRSADGWTNSGRFRHRPRGVRMISRAESGVEGGGWCQRMPRTPTAAGETARRVPPGWESGVDGEQRLVQSFQRDNGDRGRMTDEIRSARRRRTSSEVPPTNSQATSNPRVNVTAAPSPTACSAPLAYSRPRRGAKTGWLQTMCEGAIERRLGDFRVAARVRGRDRQVRSRGRGRPRRVTVCKRS